MWTYVSLLFHLTATLYFFIFGSLDGWYRVVLQKESHAIISLPSIVSATSSCALHQKCIIRTGYLSWIFITREERLSIKHIVKKLLSVERNITQQWIISEAKRTESSAYCTPDWQGLSSSLVYHIQTKESWINIRMSKTHTCLVARWQRYCSALYWRLLLHVGDR